MFHGYVSHNQRVSSGNSRHSELERSTMGPMLNDPRVGSCKVGTQKRWPGWCKNYNQFQTITSLNQPCIKHDKPLSTISRIVITHDYLVLLLNSMVINYCWFKLLLCLSTIINTNCHHQLLFIFSMNHVYPCSQY